jgi:hypothetical protein
VVLALAANALRLRRKERHGEGLGPIDDHPMDDYPMDDHPTDDRSTGDAGP